MQVSEPKIIFEDADVLVLNKPAGLAVHGDGRSNELTLVDWLLEKYPSIRDIGEAPLQLRSTNYELRTILRSGIVHRLDKETSGVLIVAKNQQAYEFLKNQFANHEVEKTYLALVYGNVKDDAGTISRPIGKSKKDFRKKSAASNAAGTLRDAVTNWRVLKRLADKDDNKFTLLEVKPKTGRTHQIRVHLAHTGHPIVCDRLYATGKPCLVGLDRHALHASHLEARLPSGEKKSFEAPPPPDFQSSLDSLRLVGVN